MVEFEIEMILKKDGNLICDCAQKVSDGPDSEGLTRKLVDADIVIVYQHFLGHWTTYKTDNPL